MNALAAQYLAREGVSMNVFAALGALIIMAILVVVLLPLGFFLMQLGDGYAQEIVERRKQRKREGRR